MRHNVSRPSTDSPGNRPIRHQAQRSPRAGNAKPKYPIESVDNALRLLLLVRDSGSIGVAEASRLLEVAPSTAHRLLAMLQHHGFVERDPSTRQYRPGPVLTELGLAALRDFDIRAAVRPHLEALVEQVGETAHLTILRGQRVFFLDCVETDKMLRAGSRVGQSLPAHATAAGKAQLAQMPDEAVRELYGSPRLPSLTETTVTTLKALLRDLAATRQRGYAVNAGESEEHLVAVGAPIRDASGVVRGAITVAAPDTRLSPQTIQRMARELLASTAAAGASLDSGA